MKYSYQIVFLDEDTLTLILNDALILFLRPPFYYMQTHKYFTTNFAFSYFDYTNYL